MNQNPISIVTITTTVCIVSLQASVTGNILVTITSAIAIIVTIFAICMSHNTYNIMPLKIVTKRATVLYL